MPDRRFVIAAGLGLLAHSGTASAQAGEPFSFETLVERARRAAVAPYRAPPAGPAAAALIDYDAAGQIRYRAEAALWREGGHAVQFFPLTRLANRPVGVFVVEKGRARPFPYSPQIFQAPAASPFHRLPRDAGFAGFRVMNPGAPTDWLAFLGASYFRAAAPSGQYGLSARGLGVDTGLSRPEEFPVFTDFWLEQSGEDLVVHALLQGPSLTGAYSFRNRRGPEGLVQDVTCVLFVRRDVEQLGVAPLTSMFWYGEDRAVSAQDWRPEIHDSDGLAIWTGGGERLWRPLNNPPRVVTSVFADENPRAFGLLQRDRAVENYEDDGVFYERRPSLWVEPQGAWGRGSVRLVEIPTRSETDDNIVAFWTPADPVRKGQRLEYRYRLRWGLEDRAGSDLACVVATRSGRAGRPGLAQPDPGRRIAIDFEGEGLRGFERSDPVRPDVTVRDGRIGFVSAYPVVGRPGRWRILVDVERTGAEPADVRATLRMAGRPLTETWTSLLF